MNLIFIYYFLDETDTFGQGWGIFLDNFKFRKTEYLKKKNDENRNFTFISSNNISKHFVQGFIQVIFMRTMHPIRANLGAKVKDEDPD